MEQVIEFLEKYWGVTLVGGTSVGTIITFIVIQIKTFAKDRAKNATINSLMDTVSNVVETFNKKTDTNEEEQAKLLAENEYLKKSQALTFKYLSYLTVASKLPIEEKLKLQEETQALQTDYKNKLTEIAEGVIKEVKEDIKEVIEEKKDEVVNILEEAVVQSGSLLDKYTKEGS